MTELQCALGAAVIVTAADVFMGPRVTATSRRLRAATQPLRREALEHPLDGAANNFQSPRNQALAVPFLKVQTQ